MARKPDLGWLLDLFDEVLSKGGEWGERTVRNRQMARAAEGTGSSVQYGPSLFEQEMELAKREAIRKPGTGPGSRDKYYDVMDPEVAQMEKLAFAFEEGYAPSAIVPGSGVGWRGRNAARNSWTAMKGDGETIGPSVAEQSAFEDEYQDRQFARPRDEENVDEMALLKKLLGGMSREQLMKLIGER